jgi:hypothetical protein
MHCITAESCLQSQPRCASRGLHEKARQVKCWLAWIAEHPCPCKAKACDYWQTGTNSWVRPEIVSLMAAGKYLDEDGHMLPVEADHGSLLCACFTPLGLPRPLEMTTKNVALYTQPYGSPVSACALWLCLLQRAVSYRETPERKPYQEAESKRKQRHHWAYHA